MSLLKPQLVNGDYLIVVPSAVPSAPVRLTPSPAILSRAEIARKRDQNMPKAPITISWSMPEIHQNDMTPIPKNKGGRPRKKRD